MKRLGEDLLDCVASWVHCDQCRIFEFYTKMKILSSHFFDNLRGLVLPSTLNSITKGSAETIWKRWRWQRFKHTSQSLIHITYEHVLNPSITFPIFANEENNNLTIKALFTWRYLELRIDTHKGTDAYSIVIICFILSTFMVN